MVTELPSPYTTMVEGFTASALKWKGMTLIEKKTIALSKGTGTYYLVSQVANGTKYLKQILLFGDSKKTVIVNGIYPDDSKSVQDDLKASLLSIVKIEGKIIDPLDGVNFKIDIKNTPFTLAQQMAGSLVFTEDGKLPSKGLTLIVGNSLQTVETKDKRAFSINRLKQLPGGNTFEVLNVKPVTIDDMPGFAIQAKSPDKDLIYQVLLFDEAGNYFMIIGMGNAGGNVAGKIKMYESIAQTFKRK